MTKKFPSIFRTSNSILDEKFSNIKELGYTKEQTISILKTVPGLYSVNKQFITSKVENIINLGYTKNDVIKMILNFPGLISLNIETVNHKINFYKTINIEKVFITNTKQLIQSVELSYARYEFYKSKNIDIDENNYRKLFISQNQFINSYGITNKELMEMYNYDLYIQEKENDRIK